MLEQEIIGRIKALAETKRFSFPQLAKSCGISKQMFYSILQGHSHIKLPLIEKLAQTFGVHPNEIITGLVGENKSRIENHFHFHITSAEETEKFLAALTSNLKVSV